MAASQKRRAPIMAPASAQAARRDFSAGQLALIRRSVARRCTDPEFDEFMAVALQCGLDPMRRQIAPLIVSADDPERRRLIPWATIDGLRVIAARQGDYRPMETAPILEADPAHIDADRNPLGLVRAEVRAWKLRHETWYPVVGEAWWNEFAPLRAEWSRDDQGRRTPSAKSVLDASWARMGRVMIAKCAEAQALRRGWPDLLSGLYGEEELHALRLLDQTASELLAQRDRTKAARTAQALWFIFDPNEGLVSVPLADAAERLRLFIEASTSLSHLDAFYERNRLSLQIFWEWAPGIAFQLKEAAEAKRVALSGAKRRRARSQTIAAPSPEIRSPKIGPRSPGETP